MIIFGNETPANRSLTCALSTERDLVSDAVEEVIKKLNNIKDVCPMKNIQIKEQSKD